MPHLHDDTLTLLAMGGAATPDEQAHLDSCPRCRADLGSFGRVVAAARDAADRRPDGGSGTDPGPSGLQAPDPSVWAAIHRELDLEPALAEDPLGSARASGDPSRTSGVPSLAAARRRRRGAWLAAAAAAVAVAAAGTWATIRTLPPAPGPEVVASADLVPLTVSPDSGTAVIDRLPDGRRELVVTSSGTAAQGYREVWLLAPDAASMVSLGTLEGTEGHFDLPADLDLSRYPVVDISDEPYDGDPAHSGTSLLRGQLDL